jgi:hypothetical protein
LRELETLSHDARARRMVALGREAATRSDVMTAVAELESDNAYARYLALHACFGSRDGAPVMRALADPSRLVRSLALRLVPLLCDDDQVRQVLEGASFTQRRLLLRRLHRRRRFGVIDAFLESLADRPGERLEYLLPFASAGVVARHLAHVQEMGTAGDWRRLARFHPALAADALRARAEAATGFDPRLLWQANAALPHLAMQHPDGALALVDALTRHAALSQLELEELTRRRPVETAERVIRSGERMVAGVAKVLCARLGRFEPQRRLDLARRYPQLFGIPDAAWFRRLTPAERAEFYAAFGRGWHDPWGGLDVDLVALLPRDLREAEARRHLALPTLAARPAQRLPYAAFLSWEEAREVVATALRDPEAELRAVALKTRVAAARFQRERAPDALDLVRNRNNEQDPVRGAMLEALADLPPGLWREEHLDALSAILQAALDAADLSYATAAHAQRLIVKLLPFHPAWAVPQLATWVRARGELSISPYGGYPWHWRSPALEGCLSDADVRRIAPHLLPVLQSWETREREPQLLHVAQALGRRLRVFDGLVEILERIARETRSQHIASGALSLIARYRRDRMDALVPELLRRDASCIVLEPVYRHVHRFRQELLPPFLGRQPYRGRFSTGKTRFVLPVYDGFHRWTPAQQTTFAKTLDDVLHDREPDTPTMLRAVAQLAGMPAAAKAPLLRLADRRNRDAAVRDAALRALARLDAGQGVPTLLEALEDDRARIAIYALRRAVLEMPAAAALALLRGVSMERVTIAKEVVRLLGDLPSEEAYQELLAMERRELHRDVRVAFLRALWSHLERDEPWPIFEGAACSPDAALATVVGRIPAERLSPRAQRRLVALLVTLLAHPEARVRLAVLQRCATLPVTDAEQALMPPLLTALGSALPDESAAAARALFATYTGEGARRVGRALAGILPDRRALQTVVQTLQGELPWRRSLFLPAVEAVLETLAADPLTVSLRVPLAVNGLSWTASVRFLTDLAETDALHPEALMAAVHAMTDAGSRPDAADLASVETEFAASADPRLRRLALAALVAQANGPCGWDDARLARLRAYRADPAPLVAAAAQFTLPVEELPTNDPGVGVPTRPTTNER